MITPEQITEGTFLLFNKPLHWTSHDVVDRVRRVLIQYCDVKKLKVGHAGTLDPLATGLLILATGKFTKRIDEIQATDKEYTGVFYLGATTASYDLETEPANFTSIENVTHEKIMNARNNFLGEIMQVPPMHSAIKKDGKAVYLIAREGKHMHLEPRKITIHRFDIPEILLPNVSFLVQCTKGTYIRSLASDFGKHLGCGAYLTELKRTKVGSYTIDEALDVNSFINEYKAYCNSR